MVRTIKHETKNAQTAARNYLTSNQMATTRTERRRNRKPYTRRWIVSNLKDLNKVRRRLKTLRLEKKDSLALNSMLALLSVNGEKRKRLLELLEEYGNYALSINAEEFCQQYDNVDMVPESILEEIQEFKRMQEHFRNIKPINFKNGSKMRLLDIKQLNRIIQESFPLKISKAQIAFEYNQAAKQGETMSCSTLFKHAQNLGILTYKSAEPKKFSPCNSLQSNEVQVFLAEIAAFMANHQDFVFVDEATVYPHDRNLKRWQLSSNELSLPKQGRLPSIKLIAAISFNGLIAYQISLFLNHSFNILLEIFAA